MLQLDLNFIAAWADMMHISSKTPKQVYDINGIALFAVEMTNNLCVPISNDLSWPEHVNEVAKKLCYFARFCVNMLICIC